MEVSSHTLVDLSSHLLYFRKRRDELSHNIFLMLQETNKFREHQSREILIEILEKQLEDRSRLVEELERDIQIADALLAGIPDRMEES